MSCELWTKQLDAYVDGEGSRESLAGLEAHLRACPECAREALGRMQLKRATQAAGQRYAPPSELRMKVLSGIGASRKPSWRMAWRPGLLGAAALLLAVITSSLVWMRHKERQQAVAELIDLHVATLASSNPVDVVSTDRHTVKPWFQGRLPFTFNLPELSGTQFRLIGGRVAWLDRSPSAQLLFATEKHSLSVFISQEQQGVIPLIEAGAARERGFHTETWSEGGLRYTVVSDAGTGDVHGLAELLRAAAKQ